LAEKLLKAQAKFPRRVNTNERMGYDEAKDLKNMVPESGSKSDRFGRNQPIRGINTMLDLSKPQGRFGMFDLEIKNYSLVIRET